MSNEKKMILIVDDDEDNRYLSEKVLVHGGFDPRTTKTGSEGVQFCREQKPDLILMDISLPDIDGIQATKQIRQIESCKEVPIIAITAYDMKEKVLKEGCTSYIQKPFQPDDLLSEVKKLIEKT